MIYQLESLEKWIRKDIAPDIWRKDFSASRIETHIEFVSGEKDRICGYFRDKVIKGDLTAPIGKLVEAHQVGIHAIIGSTIKYASSNAFDVPEEVVFFYIKVCQIIEEINTFLQRQLPEFFNEDLPVSDINARQAKEDLRSQLDTLQPLKEHPEMDIRLFRMITRPFREFIEEGKVITFRELAYLRELIFALRRLLEDDLDDILYEVHFVLFQLNFNYPRYVLYYNNWLDAKLAEISDRTQRLDRLSWHINAIEQVRFRAGCILLPGLPSITEQLLVSIKNTYKYLLENNQGIDHEVVNQINRHHSPKNDKIKLAVSVSVLALFLKALIKGGIIVNENKAEVFRAVADNFSTLKADRISYESLKSKYNKTPPSAHIHLKKTLTKIMDSIRGI